MWNIFSKALEMLAHRAKQAGHKCQPL